MAGRCLVIANQTLGGEALDDAISACLGRDVRRFHVVVPVTHVHHEAVGWTGGFGLSEAASPELVREAVEAVEADARRREAELPAARERAQLRFDRMIEKIRAMGGEADGEIGAEDPLEAARAVLEREGSFDEIIVSTLPAGLSRWLKMDLPNRIARATNIPVTTVEAES